MKRFLFTLLAAMALAALYNGPCFGQQQLAPSGEVSTCQTTTTTTTTTKRGVTAHLSRAAQADTPPSVVTTTSSAISLTAFVNGRGAVFTGLTIPIYTVGGKTFLGGNLKLVSITGVGVSPNDVGQVYSGLGLRYPVFEKNGWSAQITGGWLGMNLSNGFTTFQGTSSGLGNLFIGGSVSIPIGAP